MNRNLAKGQQTRKAKPGTASKSARNRRQSLSKDTEVVRLAQELAEAREQQTATSEVLQVISSSPGGLEPVFQAMLADATRLCEANFGVLYRFDGHVFHAVALQDAVPALSDYLRRPPRPNPRNPLGRVLITKKP